MSLNTIGLQEWKELQRDGWRISGGVVECGNCYVTTMTNGTRTRPLFLSKDLGRWPDDATAAPTAQLELLSV